MQQWMKRTVQRTQCALPQPSPAAAHIKLLWVKFQEYTSFFWNGRYECCQFLYKKASVISGHCAASCHVLGQSVPEQDFDSITPSVKKHKIKNTSVVLGLYLTLLKKRYHLWWWHQCKFRSCSLTDLYAPTIIDKSQYGYHVVKAELELHSMRLSDFTKCEKI